MGAESVDKKVHCGSACPMWIAALSAVLLGWNCAWFLSMLILIGLALLFQGLPFWPPVTVSAIFGIFVLAVVIKRTLPWFQRRQAWLGYTLLVLLLLFTFASFPRPFTFSLVDPTLNPTAHPARR